MDLKDHVNAICTHANAKGLSVSELETVFKAILPPGRLDQSSQNSLIKSLYPAEGIPNHHVLRIISSLGVGNFKSSNATQSALLKWLVLVYDGIESPHIVASCYHILFNLLDHLHLRVSLCQLLARNTQIKHIRPFRIERLKQLEASITFDANISKILDLFESLSPGSFESRKLKLPIVFPHLDTHWAEGWQRLNLQQSLKTTLATEDLRVGRPNATFDIPAESKNLVQSRDLHSVEDVARHLEKFAGDTLPDLSSKSVYLHLLLDLRQEDIEDDEQSFLVQACEDQDQLLEEGEPIEKEFLGQLLAYVRHAKVWLSNIPTQSSSQLTIIGAAMVSCCFLQRLLAQVATCT